MYNVYVFVLGMYVDNLCRSKLLHALFTTPGTQVHAAVPLQVFYIIYKIGNISKEKTITCNLNFEARNICTYKLLSVLT